MFFASDNSGPVHPKVLEALARANEGYTMGYGADDVTRRAADMVRDVLGAPGAAVHFVATGSAANSLLLGAMARPYDSVFCSRAAHIHEDECNGPEFFTGGAKLMPVGAREDLFTAAELAAEIARWPRSVHNPQLGPVSITQVTERGTLYRLDEIRDIAAVTRAYGLALHMDGARFANALVALGCTPYEMTRGAGVDALSFGGTKNGLMAVEATVVFDPGRAEAFELRRKRGAHLFSKHRYLAAQFEAYLTDGLWLEMAGAANASARRLAKGLRSIPGVSFLFEPEANMLFPVFPRAAHARAKAGGAVYHLWNGGLDGDPEEPIACRLVCDWSMTEDGVDRFLDLVAG